MANIKSQIKRNRQNEKRRVRNQAVRSELKTRIKRVEQVAASPDGSPESTETALRRAVKAIDKAAAKGTIHPNQAANRKSGLMKRLAAKVTS